MRWAGVMALAAALALAPLNAVSAQDDEAFEDDEAWDDAESGEAGADDETPDDEGEATEGEAGEDEGGGEQAAAAGARSWFFGPYFRYVFVPSFMLELFLDEAPTVANAAFGAAATYRTEDGPAFEIGVGYTGYGFDDPFRATGDPIEDTEYLESDLAMVHITGSILWDTAVVEDTLFFEYGLGLDVGILIGELVRSEARQNARGEWEACPGPSGFFGDGFCENPTTFPTDAYDATGAHYGVVEERVPPLAAVPMLPRLGLRYEPLPSELVLKVEAAYGIAQIWLGLSAAYAPEL